MMMTPVKSRSYLKVLLPVLQQNMEGNSSSPRIQMVAIANKDGINDADNGSPDNWFNFQSDYDLDAEGVYDNNDTDDAFIYITLLTNSTTTMIIFYTLVY